MYQFRSFDFDFALSALPDHPQKILALTGRCAGLALIGEDVHHRPIGSRHDFFCIIGFLVFVAVELLFTVGGYTAIGGNS